MPDTALEQRPERPHADPLAALPVVCVQGLGFVGAAMAAAIANAREDEGPRYRVVGVDLDTPLGRERTAAVNAGRPPMASTDPELAEAFAAAARQRNLSATADPSVYAEAAVIVVDVPLDVVEREGSTTVAWEGFRAAIRTLGRHAAPGALVLVETTVPPGTCERVVAPLLAEELAARGLPEDALLLAHSYERVMPGPEYYASITRFWRVYAGRGPEAAERCQGFLETILDTARFPLTRLASTTASETAKLLENSYRAVNIAFVEEWGRFAEAVGIDLFEVVDAVRVRPTHRNLRQPGFGVGGYCLTKDPLLAGVGARELFARDELAFPFSERAVEVNRVMPLVTLEHLDRALGGLAGRRLLLLGVSYRSDVGDTRHAPAETFVRAAEARGATVEAWDPLVDRWEELGRTLSRELPRPAGFDAVVFAVEHRELRELDLGSWLGEERPLVFDAHRVLRPDQAAAARDMGCRVLSIGRGEGA